MPAFLLHILIVFFAWLPRTAWPVQYYSVAVTDKKPQSRDIYVQGLEIKDGLLYVGTGLYGKSRLLRYRFTDGTPHSAIDLDKRFFGEGITVLGDKVYQLTWRNRTMLVYRRDDLELVKTLPVQGEGWGLTNNGHDLIYSDGSATLRYLSPVTAKVLREIHVTLNGRPVTQLNELEWVNDAVWANVWRQDAIVIIDPDNGEVTGTIDLRGLLPRSEHERSTDVLNGIARDAADGSIWVTGKRWPWLYQIELVPQQTDGAK
ncbi:MAG: glutaminyl-peptide cyclotransferase [Halioglobus sp.]|nr:glutaminyl-peptide cyclotransferase [Halioglobus sp.]